MYYYINEAGNAKTAAWQEKIKDILGDLGIAGETVTPSPARTIEELASLGIIKGYSTIVAVGSEKLVNKVVTALINQDGNKETVLGIIPTDFEGILAKTVGVKDIKEACLALKHRKLQTIDACQIDPNKYFLTEAIIETARATEAYISLDKIQAGLIFNKITIKPGLEIIINDQSKETVNKVKQFWSKLFGKTMEVKDIYSSLFQSKTLKLETIGRSLSVKVDDEIITKTPIICSARPKALRIIVAKENLSKTQETKIS